MEKKEKIYEVLAALYSYWMKATDMRLGQIIETIRRHENALLSNIENETWIELIHYQEKHYVPDRTMKKDEEIIREKLRSVLTNSYVPYILTYSNTSEKEIRNPERIIYIISALHDYWIEHPYKTLGNVIETISEKSSDIYSVEDHYWFSWLRKKTKQPHTGIFGTFPILWLKPVRKEA